MRALVLATDYPPAFGGIQTLLGRTVEGWTRLEPVVIARWSPGASEFDASQPYRIVRVPERLMSLGHRSSIIALNILGAAAAAAEPTVVLSGHVLLVGASRFVAKVRDVPMVQFLHADEMVAFPRATRFAVEAANVTLTVSQYCENIARSIARGGNYIRVPFGVDARPNDDRRECVRPTLLTVARLTDVYKGHDVMMEAMPLILDSYPDAQWVLVGDGDLRPGLESRARELRLQDAVRFEGAVTDAVRDNWYDSAHLFVMLSRIPPRGGGEGFGIVYLEAAAHGLPSIGPDCGGPREAVLDGVTGLHVDPTDPGKVARAVIRLLSDEGLRVQFGEAARRRALSTSWAKTSRVVEDILLDQIRRKTLLRT